VTKIPEKHTAKIDGRGEKLAKTATDVSTSQLRQIYSELKQAEHLYYGEDDIQQALREVQLLKPRLAYMTARDESIEEFRDQLSKIIDRTVEKQTPVHLEYLFATMEATIGYHTYEGEHGTVKLEAGKKKLPDNIDKTAEKHAKKYYDDGVGTSQIRNIYAEITRARSSFRQVGYSQTQDDSSLTSEQKRLLSETRKSLNLLLPKLTYIAGRNEEAKQLVVDLRGWIHSAVNGDGNDLDTFFELVEAIVAYHKYYSETNGDSA